MTKFVLVGEKNRKRGWFLTGLFVILMSDSHFFEEVRHTTTHSSMEAIMKFMIFVKSNSDLEKTIDEMSEASMKQSMAEMEVFNDELRKAGVLKECDGLRLSREGKRVRFDGQSRAIKDGPSMVIWWPVTGYGSCPTLKKPLPG